LYLFIYLEREFVCDILLIGGGIWIGAIH